MVEKNWLWLFYRKTIFSAFQKDIAPCLHGRPENTMRYILLKSPLLEAYIEHKYCTLICTPCTIYLQTKVHGPEYHSLCSEELRVDYLRLYTIACDTAVKKKKKKNRHGKWWREALTMAGGRGGRGHGRCHRRPRSCLNAAMNFHASTNFVRWISSGRSSTSAGTSASLRSMYDSSVSFSLKGRGRRVNGKWTAFI